MMILQDWRDEAAYAPLLEYDGAAWAWEFLRRNPRYQAEWADFHATWEALEAAYGRPPDRDFCAWKNDPRAWVRADEADGGDCRIDQDKVLIECALGARWGFHKFPPDPRDAQAALEGRIAWRPRAPARRRIDPEQAPQTDPLRQVLMRFDLDLPLREQIEQAKRELQLLQRQRRREAGLTMRSVRSLAPHLQRELRLLDAEAAGALEAALPQLGGAAVLEDARARRDGGYLELPLLQAR